MSTTQGRKYEWATPQMKEAPFWREGMSPEEYDLEREYLGKNYSLFMDGTYKPLWKQSTENQTA